MEGVVGCFRRCSRPFALIIKCTNSEEEFVYPAMPGSPKLATFDVRERSRDLRDKNMMLMLQKAWCAARESGLDLLLHCVDSSERAPLVCAIVMKFWTGVGAEVCVHRPY